MLGAGIRSCGGGSCTVAGSAGQSDGRCGGLGFVAGYHVCRCGQPVRLADGLRAFGGDVILRSGLWWLAGFYLHVVCVSQVAIADIPGHFCCFHCSGQRYALAM